MTLIVDAARFEAAPRFPAYLESVVKLADLWNHPLLLGFLLTMLAADWVVRKLWNLP